MTKDNVNSFTRPIEKTVFQSIELPGEKVGHLLATPKYAIPLVNIFVRSGTKESGVATFKYFVAPFAILEYQ